MNNDALIKFIEYLARSSPELWRQMVGYHRAQSWTQIAVDVTCLLCSIASIFLALKAFKYAKKLRDTRESHGRASDAGDGTAFLGGVLLVGAIILATVIGIHLPEDAAKAAYPQRAAALDMIEQMKRVPK